MLDDTIAAISTPLGEGGIGIVRLSGKASVSIVATLFSPSKDTCLEDAESRRLIHGFIKDAATGARIDEVLVAVMRAPHTYTREDVVEINCHGGILPLRKTLELALKQGARLAEPGEFTKRAFLNGRIDLSQAEAVIDLIHAKTEESGRIALEQLSGGLSSRITAARDKIASICTHIEAYIDFPEDEIEPDSLRDILGKIKEIKSNLSRLSESFEEGRFFREGLKVAIVGRPNVGKSSLLNALLERDRAIVTDVPGTTRDVLEEYLNIKGLPVRVMDTAGIREAHEMAEKEGVTRSLNAIAAADIVVGVLDGTTALNGEDRMVLDRMIDKKSIVAVNKSDLITEGSGPEIYLDVRFGKVLMISAKTGAGLDLLKDTILEVSTAGRRRSAADSPLADNVGVVVTNLRHKMAIDMAADALERAAGGLAALSPLEIVSVEMRDALDRLGEIVGAVTTQDILNKIFREFCIGK